MDDTEGSVATEDSDIDETSESTDEQGTDTESQTDEGKTEATDSTSDDGTLKGQEKTERTEKGTKLDPNPLSRINQELANERAKIREYEEVLNSPALLRKYVSQFENTDEDKKGEKGKETEVRIQDVQTTEDLHKFLTQQEGKVKAKIKELDSTISHVKSTQKDTVIASRIQSDITTVREQYPELNPKSSSYNKELDSAIGELYEKYDYDPETKSFMGNVSIKDVANIVMRAAGSSKRKGSEEAQTEIRDRRTGRVISGASKTSLDTSKMSPGQIIAARIRAARGGR